MLFARNNKLILDGLAFSAPNNTFLMGDETGEKKVVFTGADIEEKKNKVLIISLSRSTGYKAWNEYVDSFREDNNPAGSIIGDVYDVCLNGIKGKAFYSRWECDDSLLQEPATAKILDGVNVMLGYDVFLPSGDGKTFFLLYLRWAVTSREGKSDLEIIDSLLKEPEIAGMLYSLEFAEI